MKIISLTFLLLYLFNFIKADESLEVDCKKLFNRMLSVKLDNIDIDGSVIPKSVIQSIDFSGFSNKCTLNYRNHYAVKFSLADIEETDGGIRGRVVMELPDLAIFDDLRSKQLGLPAKLPYAIDTFKGICRKIGYNGGKKWIGRFKDGKKGYALGIDGCQELLKMFYDNKLKKSGIEKILNIVKTRDCVYEQKLKDHLGIECFSSTGREIQSTSCRNMGNECPLGYSKNEDLDSKDGDSICWPNICKCQDGIPAASNYEYIKNTCGLVAPRVPKDDLNTSLSLRIYNGHKSDKATWPFIVLLFTTGNDAEKVPFCSSAIINPEFLLTAAHCLYDGEENKRGLPFHFTKDWQWFRTSEKTFIHRSYDYNNGDPINDIAIIQLSTAIRFNEHTRPICFNQNENDNISLQGQLFLAGFGDDEKFVETTFYQSNCTYKDRDHMNSTRFCVISNSKSNTCQGDSGSPLMQRILDDIDGELVYRWYLVGILSTGPEKCDIKSASESTFTRVANYSDWINQIINLNNNFLVGKYCSQDKGRECGSCNSGHKLIDSKCEKEFTDANLNLFVDYLNDYKCAERCLDVIGCKNMAGTFLPKFKDCICHHGEPTEQCSSSDIENCNPLRCDENYYYHEPDRSCVRAKLPNLHLIMDKTDTSKFIAKPVIRFTDTDLENIEDYQFLDDIKQKDINKICQSRGLNQGSKIMVNITRSHDSSTYNNTRLFSFKKCKDLMDNLLDYEFTNFTPLWKIYEIENCMIEQKSSISSQSFNISCHGCSENHYLDSTNEYYPCIPEGVKISDDGINDACNQNSGDLVFLNEEIFELDYDISQILVENNSSYTYQGIRGEVIFSPYRSNSDEDMIRFDGNYLGNNIEKLHEFCEIFGYESFEKEHKTKLISRSKTLCKNSACTKSKQGRVLAFDFETERCQTIIQKILNLDQLSVKGGQYTLA